MSHFSEAATGIKMEISEMLRNVTQHLHCYNGPLPVFVCKTRTQSAFEVARVAALLL